MFDSTLHEFSNDQKYPRSNLIIANCFRSKQADQWFEFLKLHVHPEVERGRKDSQKPVRIAILDTGVDTEHPDIALALKTKRIAVFKGFPDSLLPRRDHYGHGTHGASVLMQTAPEIRLYVARVANDKGKITDENDYLNTANVNLFHQDIG